MKHTLIASAAALALAGIAPIAAAADDAELAQIRDQIAQMKAQYEARIEALEKRLAAAEKNAPAAAAGAPASLPAATAASGAASGFNPQISLILQGQYRNQKEIPGRSITGFWPAGGHAHGEAPEIDERGLSLDHSELVLSANVDPNFRGQATLAFADGETEVEEAWFQTLGLGNGLTLRGGRFLSGIGYINEQHPHAWDFADAPLTSRALFGERFVQDGVQLRWVAPTELFVELGAEVGRGAGFPGTDRNRNRPGAGALFAHVGGDFGASHAWRGGLSFLKTKAADREAEFADLAGDDLDAAFTGRSRTWIADFVWKWAPQGNARSQSFRFQSEYFRRHETGTLACSGASVAACAGDPDTGYRSRQSGYYAQAIYQFAPAWRIGYRYDRLSSGSVGAGLVDAGVIDPASSVLAAYRPQRQSVMLDWSPSEFSRLRLQVNNDEAMQGVTDRQVILQYIMSLGAHGAHRF